MDLVTDLRNVLGNFLAAKTSKFHGFGGRFRGFFATKNLCRLFIHLKAMTHMAKLTFCLELPRDLKKAT